MSLVGLPAASPLESKTERHRRLRREAATRYRRAHPGRAAEVTARYQKAHPERRAAWKNRPESIIRARASTQRSVRRRRDFINSIKMARGCELCGYREHPAALDFDHVDPAAKTFTIAKLCAGRSLDKVLAEISKCRVLCSNCHRIESFNQRHGAIRKGGAL
jgi:hypothetical protein